MAKPSTRRHVAMSWAQRLKRVFGVEMEGLRGSRGATVSIDCQSEKSRRLGVTWLHLNDKIRSHGQIRMKIVIISDTHAGHEALGTLAGDVLIHCGDFGYGRDSALGEARRLDAWFERQSFGLILCIGGNHDFGVEESVEHGVRLFRHATYLQDSGVVFGSVSFYGAPWVPQLRGWAHYQGHAGLKEKRARIPVDTDVLITHTPPYGILDTNSRGHQCGCEHLLERLKHVRPRLHCFGHVHASAGVHEWAGTTYVNASMVNRTYQVVRAPFEVEL